MTERTLPIKTLEISSLRSTIAELSPLEAPKLQVVCRVGSFRSSRMAIVLNNYKIGILAGVHYNPLDLRIMGSTLRALSEVRSDINAFIACIDLTRKDENEYLNNIRGYVETPLLVVSGSESDFFRWYSRFGYKYG